ncbi:hypothetical protein FHG87_000066 [Trinorchestia longiramus]|nr:hypothetical protein FHG87_000066 [Trinorchestia longiramus]
MVPPECYRKHNNRLLEDAWHRNNTSLYEETLEAAAAARLQQLHSRAARNEAHTTSVRQAAHSSDELRQRTWDIHSIVRQLQHHLQQVEKEQEDSQRAREYGLVCCDRRQTPLETAVQCLAVRETRREGELVDDRLERCLNEEVSVLQRSRAALEKILQEALQSCRKLSQSSDALKKDLADKMQALEVDIATAQLTPHHSDVSFKPGPLNHSTLSHHLPSQVGLSVPDWRQRSVLNMEMAAMIIREAQNTRSKLCAEAQRCDNEDCQSQRATDFALRRRNHETTVALKGLQWQKKELLSTADQTEQEIRNVEMELASTQLLLKTVHTRLEDRKARPNNELTVDAAHDQLVVEERQLRNTRENLREKLSDTKKSLHELQQRLRAVNHEIGLKSVSLRSEQQMAGLRGNTLPKIVSVSSAPDDPTDSGVNSLTRKNMELTGSLQRCSSILLS